MLNQTKIFSIWAGLGFVLVLTTSSGLAQKELEVAMPTSAVEQMSHFQKIEQPLGLKLLVALGGFGLISVELWWFMFSQTQSRKALIKQGIQEIDIISRWWLYTRQNRSTLW